MGDGRVGQASLLRQRRALRRRKRYSDSYREQCRQPTEFAAPQRRVSLALNAIFRFRAFFGDLCVDYLRMPQDRGPLNSIVTLSVSSSLHPTTRRELRFAHMRHMPRSARCRRGAGPDMSQCDVLLAQWCISRAESPRNRANPVGGCCVSLTMPLRAEQQKQNTRKYRNSRSEPGGIIADGPGVDPSQKGCGPG